MSEISAATMSLIAKQIKTLVRRPIDGVRYVSDKGSLTEIHAIITGPERTPFEGGEFHVKLVLGTDYPAAPPKGTFLTRIFHPNISTEGSICVNTLKRDWKPDVGLSHVLQVIRCLLIVPFPESSLNDDAGKLFMESYDEFARRARLMTSIHARPAGGSSAPVAVPAAAAATSSASLSSATSSASTTTAVPATAAAAAAAAGVSAEAAAASSTGTDEGAAVAAGTAEAEHSMGACSRENKKPRADKGAGGKAKGGKGRKALKRL